MRGPADPSWYQGKHWHSSSSCRFPRVQFCRRRELPASNFADQEAAKCAPFLRALPFYRYPGGTVDLNDARQFRNDPLQYVRMFGSVRFDSLRRNSFFLFPLVVHLGRPQSRRLEDGQDDEMDVIARVDPRPRSLSSQTPVARLIRPGTSGIIRHESPFHKPRDTRDNSRRYGEIRSECRCRSDPIRNTGLVSGTPGGRDELTIAAAFNSFQRPTKLLYLVRT